MNSDLKEQLKEMQNNFDKKSEVKPYIDLTYGEYLGKSFEIKANELNKMYIDLLNQEYEMETIQQKLRRKFHSPEASDTFNKREYLVMNKEELIKKSEEKINIKLNDLHHLANLLKNM